MVVTSVLLKLVSAFAALKATVSEEGQGLDVCQHGEEAYTSGDGALLLLSNSIAERDALLILSEEGSL